jgi:hypothetical protein
MAVWIGHVEVALTPHPLADGLYQLARNKVRGAIHLFVQKLLSRGSRESWGVSGRAAK